MIQDERFRVYEPVILYCMSPDEARTVLLEVGEALTHGANINAILNAIEQTIPRGLVAEVMPKVGNGQQGTSQDH